MKNFEKTVDFVYYTLGVQVNRGTFIVFFSTKSNVINLKANNASFKRMYPLTNQLIALL